jgi:glucose/arabinose dehydrogenase
MKTLKSASLDQPRTMPTVGNLNQAPSRPPPGALLSRAASGDDFDRAEGQQFTADKGAQHIFVTTLWNHSAEVVQTTSGGLWCVVKRDSLGGKLPPNFAIGVQPRAFHRWPWSQIGRHLEPQMSGAKSEFAGHVTMPNVLMHAYSVPLGIVFYDGRNFSPARYGDAFVALRGSRNCSPHTDHKVVRLRIVDGKPTGVCDVFPTGFVASDQTVRAPPVKLIVTHDRALLVSEGGAGEIWRVSCRATQ